MLKIRKSEHSSRSKEFIHIFTDLCVIFCLFLHSRRKNTSVRMMYKIFCFYHKMNNFHKYFSFSQSIIVCVCVFFSIRLYSPCVEHLVLFLFPPKITFYANVQIETEQLCASILLMLKCCAKYIQKL